MRPGALLAVAAFAAVAAGASSAQQPQSPGYTLLDWALDGGGGGTCSLGHAAYAALPGLSGAEMTSLSYRASIGFLAANDPQPTNAPVVFGVAPDCGPLAGDTAITVSGLNFEKLGAGATLSVSVGGSAAGSLAVASDTMLTCTTPPGPAGSADVSASSLHGTGTLAEGFHYTAGLAAFGAGTPGCTGAEVMGATTCPRVDTPAFALTCSNAPPGTLGLALVADAADVAGSDPFGLGVVLHVDLFGALEILALDFPVDASGKATAPAPISAAPGLVGKTYYAQGLFAWSGPCVPSLYGLSTSNGLALTIQP